MGASFHHVNKYESLSCFILLDPNYENSVDSSEWVSRQPEKVFQISLEDKNESLMLTQEIIYLEQGSLNIWRRLKVNLIFKVESATAQESTKNSHCHLKC